MKNFGKGLIVTVLVLSLATVALAAGGPGSGMMRGQGMGPCGGNCCGGKGMMGQNQAAPENISLEQATTTLNEYVANNLKGYQVEKIEAIERPRATMYAATVTDAGGNTFSLHLNPWGIVRGPFLQNN